LVLALLLSVAARSQAHPDLVEQISEITEKMRLKGTTPERLLQRAELLRSHSQFDAALMDIVTAERLQTNAPPLLLERARILCDSGQTKDALAAAQEILAHDTNHVEALILRAKCRARLGETDAAVTDYSTAIARCDSPGSDLFLQRARLLAALGKLAEASQSLEEVTSNTPFASPLHLAAIAYDRQGGAFDSALARTDAIIAFYPIKEPWLTLRAEILEQAGRREDANKTFRCVIAGIESYPAIRRTLEITKQLEERARAGLMRTDNSSAKSATPLRRMTLPN
jgi:tetratricopeptide (TPR) repeat protein